VQPVILSETCELASPPSDVWRVLADTDRLNRRIGLARIEARPAAKGIRSAARFVVATRLGGIPTEYDELPFEWIEERSFRVARRMRGGPLASMTLSMRLDKGRAEGGTRVTMSLEIVPRTSLVLPVAWIGGRRALRRMMEVARAIDEQPGDRADGALAIPPVSQVEHATLERARVELAGAAPREIVASLVEHVRSAADADCVRMRPFELADQWSADRLDALRVFLHAVSAGLVELRWGVICPSCATASEQHRTLAELTSTGHCQLCDISFELDLDRAVEATFVPHEAVRKIPDQLFCVGGPSRTPHVVVQAHVDAGRDARVEAPSRAGRYRFFARGGAVASVDVADDAPAEAELVVEDAGARPAQVRVAPGGALRVTNATREDRHVKVERLAYAAKAATAQILSTLPEFRKTFSRDILKRGTPLKVSRVAILFSDLTGSTALYTHVGDAAAFRVVDDHFDVMRGVVQDEGGVVVKTMGDAVLAAFSSADACARAAVRALVDFETFRGGLEHGDRIGLKLGMYDGACYVVSANGALDYFGQTVNIASRVQHLADSGELVLAESLYEGLPAAIRDRTEVKERFQARVKGVADPLHLARLRLAPAPSG